MAKSEKTSRITEPKFVAIINEEYQRAKHILFPLLKGVNRSFVKFWWHKPNRYGGVCWRYAKQITLSENYRDKQHEKDWTEEQFRMCLRHELVHLSGASNHASGQFLSRLKALGGHRYVGHPAFEGKKLKK